MLTLSGANSYLGATTVSGGTLLATAPAALPDYTLVSVAGGATLAVRAGGAGEWDSAEIDSLVTSASSGFSTGSKLGIEVLGTNNFDHGGDITGYMGLVKTGTGTLTLSGVNSYSGSTAVNTGTLMAMTPDALSNYATAGNVSVASGATLSLRAGGTGEWGVTEIGSLLTANGTNLAAGSKLALDVLTGNTLVLDNTVSIAGGMTLVKANAGTLTLSGNNSALTGGVTLNAGVLNINSATALGTGTFTINGGTINNTTTAALALTTNNPQTWAADFTFTGTQALDLGAGAVTLAAGTGTANGSPLLTLTAGTLTIGGPIGGPAGLGLYKTGAGTLVLNGKSTYADRTELRNRTLMIGVNDALPTGTTLYIGNSGTANTNTITFDLAGYNQTVSGLVFTTLSANTNPRAITNSNATTPSIFTLNNANTATVGSTGTTDGGTMATISGNLSLVKQGAGSLILNNTNTYTGQTIIQGGTVKLGKATALGTSVGAVGRHRHPVRRHA